MFSRNTKIKEKFLKISREHEIIKDYVLKFQDILYDKSANPMRALRKAVKSFEHDLLAHFKLEETFIFPTALLCMQDIHIVDLVLTLQKSHGHFERDMRDLLNMIQDTDNAQKDIPEHIKAHVSAFSKNMLEHAEYEMNDLFPKLDENKRANEIIQGFVE